MFLSPNFEFNSYTQNGENQILIQENESKNSEKNSDEILGFESYE